MFLSSKKRTLAFFYTRKAFSQIWPRTLFTVTRSLFQMTIKTYPQIQVLVSPSFFVWMYYLIFLNGNASKCLSRYGVILGSNQSGFKIGKLSKKKAENLSTSINLTKKRCVFLPKKQPSKWWILLIHDLEKLLNWLKMSKSMRKSKLQASHTLLPVRVWC